MKIEIEEIQQLNEIISQGQLIFNKTISPNGIVDYELLNGKLDSSEVCILFDRNILSLILELAREGNLKSKRSINLVGLILSWSYIYNLTMISGLAVMEYSTNKQSEDVARKEIADFNRIIKNFSPEIWLNMARGSFEEIPRLDMLIKMENNHRINQVEFADGCDFYHMAVAAMIHLVIVSKKRCKPIDKAMEYIEWLYKNTVVSELVFKYSLLVFTGEKNIQLPHHANSKNIDKVINGCKNQAWDLTYILYAYLLGNKFNGKEILFATDDEMTKRLIMYSNYELDRMVANLFSKNDFKKLDNHIWKLLQARDKNNHYSVQYYKDLQENEKKLLSEVIGDEE